MGGWLAGLTETKTKPNPKLKLELNFGAELCNSFSVKHFFHLEKHITQLFFRYQFYLENTPTK